MVDGNFMVGTISYLPDDLPKLKKRISHHSKQLEWLERIPVQFPYYRIESSWGEQAKAAGELKTVLPLYSISVKAQYPGANRNELLKLFYESDCDWLVCLDDDHCLYDRYDSLAFFKDLSSPALRRLARQGFMITCLPANMMPYKKDNYEWPYRETHWYLHRESISGYLQICFIPNLVKFGYSPIWFNGDTPCKEDDAPEDIQFQIDWLLHRHRFICNKNLIMREIGQSAGQDSSIYLTPEERKACTNKHKAWAAQYLRKQLPRTPGCWTTAGLNKKMNPHFTELVPRSTPYTFSDIELPRGVKK